MICGTGTATETPIVVNADWEGRRASCCCTPIATGSSMFSTAPMASCFWPRAFVRNLTWASGIGADGRPIKTSESDSDAGGNQGVSVAGRRDELVLAFVQSGDGPVYLQTFEKCSIYSKRMAACGQPARRFLAASQKTSPDPKPRAHSESARTSGRAKLRGNFRSRGRRESWGGTLATATGLVIFGAETGELMAADAVTGKPLWSFRTNDRGRLRP